DRQRRRQPASPASAPQRRRPRSATGGGNRGSRASPNAANGAGARRGRGRRATAPGQPHAHRQRAAAATRSNASLHGFSAAFLAAVVAFGRGGVVYRLNIDRKSTRLNSSH